MPAPVTPRGRHDGPLSGAYRAVWRWHFYAGLFTLPVLCLMALTGAVYLFKAEIEEGLYGRWLNVPVRAGQTAPDRWARAAEAALGGRASAVTTPERPGRAAIVTVETAGGERRAWVDPYDAHVLGSAEGEGALGVVKQIHSLSLFGKPFNILVEIVAGWAVILVATGIFLWWPRRRDAATFVVRKGVGAGRRAFWRDLHALTGLYAGLVVAFLAVTGMPWSAVWGDRFLGAMRESGLGRPPAPAASGGWEHAEHDDAPAGTGWTMEAAVLSAPGDGDVGLAAVFAAVDAAGMPRPYTVSIPREPDRAFTASRVAQRAEDARSLYVDPHTGRIIGDARWPAFGVGAKAFEWGIAVHEGRQYGWANRIVMLSGCVAVWLLATSALAMWWKRRPKGMLGAPAAPPGPRARAAVLGIVLPLAILYPLTGLSLLAAILVDHAYRALRVRRPLVEAA